VPRDDKIRELAAIRKRLMLLVGALLVAGVGISWLIDPEAFALYRGDLEVSSVPTGAEVYINGELRASTPDTIRGIPAGEVVVKLVHRFHEDAVRTAQIDADETTRLEHTFAPAVGTLEIISNPTEGYVVLNDEQLPERTPYKITSMATGSYEVTVGFKHHRDVSRTVEVLPGRTTREVFELPLAPWGTLTLNVAPANTRITFVDLDTPYSPGMELPAGEYAVQLSKSGYPSQQHRVRVGVGDNTYSFQLEALQVPIRITATPKDAEITLKYRTEGINRVRPYGPDSLVGVGKVTVIARAQGYRTQRRTINVGDQGASLNIGLERFNVSAGERFSDTLRSGGKGPQLVVVGPGSYQMGDISGLGAADEKPVHTVNLTQPFAIGIHEITRGDYARYLENTGDQQPMTEDLDYPVADLTIKAINDYLRWLSEQTGYQYRLPSEAEWEYAARAGSRGRFAHGDDTAQLCEYANIADQSTKSRYSTWDVAQCTDGFAKLAPVGSLKPNAFGLYDTSGNVSEWVADCWSGNYKNARSDETPFDDGPACHRVFRGGSWDSQVDTVTVSYRNSSDRSNDDRGFRVVREL
jgi:formylglycine-generating enzyme required for sulfatase activity